MLILVRRYLVEVSLAIQSKVETLYLPVFNQMELVNVTGALSYYWVVTLCSQ